MKYSQKGLDFTASFEGLRLEAYQDIVGVWTIGYGHTKDVKRGDTISRTRAMELLKQDVEEAVAAVNRLVKVKLTQGQFDALVDFVFNLGSDEDIDTVAEGLGDSTLLKKLNAKDYEGARQEFLKWNKARVGGKMVVVAGLTRRRQGEMDMFV